MCNLSDFVENRGIEKGVVKGRIEERESTVKKLYKSGMSPTAISVALELTIDEVNRYLNL